MCSLNRTILRLFEILNQTNGIKEGELEDFKGSLLLYRPDSGYVWVVESSNTKQKGTLLNLNSQVTVELGIKKFIKNVVTLGKNSFSNDDLFIMKANDFVVNYILQYKS